MDWYEREVKRIEADYEAGDIDNDEYHARMRDLNDQLNEEADRAAEGARSDVLGY